MIEKINKINYQILNYPKQGCQKGYYQILYRVLTWGSRVSPHPCLVSSIGMSLNTHTQKNVFIHST